MTKKTFYACPVCGELQEAVWEVNEISHEKVAIKCKACENLSECKIYDKPGEKKE